MYGLWYICDNEQKYRSIRREHQSKLSSANNICPNKTTETKKNSFKFYFSQVHHHLFVDFVVVYSIAFAFIIIMREEEKNNKAKNILSITLTSSSSSFAFSCRIVVIKVELTTSTRTQTKTTVIWKIPKKIMNLQPNQPTNHHQLYVYCLEFFE